MARVRKRRSALWSNWQCKITPGQLVLDDGTRHGYGIEKKRLLERNSLATGEPVYDWPMHLAGKGWSSNHYFAEAFLKAVELWKLEPKFDRATWDRTQKHLAEHPKGW